MENFVSGGLKYLFPGECYQTVVEEMNFFDGKYFCYEYYCYKVHTHPTPHAPLTLLPGPCLKFLFSRLLSLVVIAGAVIGR